MKKIILILSFLFLAACGGNITEIAEKSLYPYEQANKTVVPDIPYETFSEHFLNITTKSKNNNQNEKLKIHIWFHEHQLKEAPVLIYAHGNGMNIGSLAESGLLDLIKSLNTHVVVFDYPKYGKSTGTITQETLTQSGIAVLEWAQNNFNKNEIVFWGRSLGAAVASQVASKRQQAIKQLILTSGWDNLLSVALHHTSLAKNLPQDWIRKHEWNSAFALKSFLKPVLMQHGEVDDLVPLPFGQKLFDNVGSSTKELIVIEGKSHNDIFNSEILWQSIREALTRISQ